MEYTENDYLRQKLLESTDISEIPEGTPSKWQQKKKSSLTSLIVLRISTGSLPWRCRQKTKSLQDGNFQIKLQSAKGFLNKMEVMKENTIPLSEQKSILKWNSLKY